MNEKTLSSGTDDVSKEEKDIDPEVLTAIGTINHAVWYSETDKENPESIHIPIEFFLEKTTATFLLAFFRILDIDPSHWFQLELENTVERFLGSIEAITENLVGYSVKQLRKQFENKHLKTR